MTRLLKLENFYVWNFLCWPLSYNSTEKESLYVEAVGRCLGEVGPIDFSTIAIQHSKDMPYTKALELFEDKEHHWTLMMLTYLNSTLVEDWWVFNDTLYLILNLTFKEIDTSYKLTFPIIKASFKSSYSKI